MLSGFFLLTFAFTWGVWLAWAALNRRGLAGTGALFLLGVFAPALVALALTALVEGVGVVRQLIARIGRWEVPARWYVFAVLYFAAIKLTAALIQRIATGSWPAFSDTPWPLMFGTILVSMSAQAGEELGWRGYALPRLAQRVGLGTASVVLGVIWATWHLPLFLLPGTGSDGQSFPIYLLQVTALSVAMTWLYWKTGGSLLLVMVMHASVNNTTGMVPAAVPGAADPFAFSGSLVAWITVALSWMIAAPLMYQMRRAEIGALLNQDVMVTRVA